MTNDELKAIEERAIAAPPGPREYIHRTGWSLDPYSPEGVLFKHCREDVLVLCAEVRRLQATEAVLNSEVQRLRAALALSEEQDETLLATDVEGNK